MPVNVLKNIFLILLPFILAQAPAFSQTKDYSHGPLELGAALGMLVPAGEFRSNVGGWSLHESGAINLDLIIDLRGSDFLRLRFDIIAGSKPHALILYGLGSEVGLSRGPILPYMNAGYEWLKFDAIYYPFTEEHFHGGSGFFVGGGGRIPLGSKKRWAIDIGCRYHLGGTATYMISESYKKNPDGTFNIFPNQSSMHFMILTLGFQWRPFLDRKNP